jgi:hypothetical protein
MLEAWLMRAPGRLVFQQMLVGIDLQPRYSSRGITVLDWSSWTLLRGIFTHLICEVGLVSKARI